MRIIFMGTPAFAVATLDALCTNGYEVVAVVTAPDKPAGRGQQLHTSDVKKYAVAKNIPVLQPVKLKDEEFISQLQGFRADLQIVVAFRMLPEVVWTMPPLGTYNLHGSLLPKYRGAAPINWAIINGETESGVTTFKLKHEVDTGNILFWEKVNIGNTTTAGELHDALMLTGAKLMVKTVKAIVESHEKGTQLDFIMQKDKEVSHAPKIYKETCRIKWNESPVQIFNLIRGLSPSPAAFTMLYKEAGDAPQSIKLYAAHLEEKEHSFTNGSLLTDNKSFLKVYCSGGLLNVLDLQLQGKKRMFVSDFLKGFKFEKGWQFL